MISDGVSTRRVDELVQAMGLSGISKSQVSKLCKEIDERVNAFLNRPIEGDWPYLWLDAIMAHQFVGLPALLQRSRVIPPHPQPQSEEASLNQAL